MGDGVAAIDPDAAWKSIGWAAHTHDALVRGRRVRYIDIGSGPALVLIHGQGGSWQWWLRNLPFLASHYRVIALDLAGFGESDPVVVDGVFDEQVATVVGLLDWLSLASATLVGHSMGGLVALEVASNHPDRVSELVLVDAGGAYLRPIRLRVIVTAFRAFNTVFSVPWIPFAVARRPLLRRLMFAVAVRDRRSVTESLALEIVPRMAAPGFVASLEAAAVAIGAATPEKVTCRCLVIWGGRDRILPVETGRLLASRIADARLVVVENAGHCVMFEAPEQFNELLTGAVHEPSRRPAG